jgi:hypothetical protein
MTSFTQRRAERLAKIPLRTLADVQQDLARAKRTKADKSLARAMLLFGRLEPAALDYVKNHYPLS